MKNKKQLLQVIMLKMIEVSFLRIGLFRLPASSGFAPQPSPSIPVYSIYLRAGLVILKIGSKYMDSVKLLKSRDGGPVYST